MAVKTKLPKFQGIPLIKIPEYIPTANFLGGNFGKAVLKEYKQRAKSDYNNASVLNVLEYENGVVKGSNPFTAVLINQIIKSEGLRTATQADLEKILKINAFDLRGFYEDPALVLRNEGEPNKYLAQHLAKQIKARQNKNKNKYPVMIPLNGLELKNDQNSDYGLAFKLTDETEIIYAPELNNKNNNKTFSQTNENGLPIFNEQGNRNLYTISPGLSGLYLSGYLDLDSYCNDLAGSNSGGRVIVVSSEAVS